MSDDKNLDDISQFIVSGKSGDFIFHEGDAGTEMYIIRDGEIEILKAQGSSTLRLAVLEPGDFFGEMSLLEDMPRDASARALEDYKLIRIDHSTFDQMVQENPEIAVRMLRALSNRLRERQPGSLKAPPTAQDESPRPAPSRAMLVHQPSGTEFAISLEGETTIGRVDHVTGISPDIDFSELDTHRTLSRRHAKISRQEDGYYLREDIGTSNGTFVNGERIKTGVPVKIQDGDEIRFGHTTTVFHCA